MLSRQKEKFNQDPNTEPSSPARSDIMDEASNMPSSPEMICPSRLMVRREDTPDPDDLISAEVYGNVANFINAKKESALNKFYEDYYSLETRTELLLQEKELQQKADEYREKLEEIKKKKMLLRINKWKIVHSDLKKVDEIKKRLEAKKLQELEEQKRLEEQKKKQQQMEFLRQQTLQQQQQQQQQQQNNMLLAQLINDPRGLLLLAQHQQQQQQQAAALQAIMEHQRAQHRQQQILSSLTPEQQLQLLTAQQFPGNLMNQQQNQPK